MLVENTKPRLVHLSGTKALKPGVNHVVEADWAKAKKLPLIKTLLASGELVEAGADPEVESEAPAAPVAPPAEALPLNKREVAPEGAKALEGKNAGEAIDLVSRTLDRSLLEAWFVEEKRVTVLAAIEKQLDKLQPTEADIQAAKE